MPTALIHNAPNNRCPAGGEYVWRMEEGVAFEDPRRISDREMRQIVLSEEEWERIFHLGSTINIVDNLLLHVEGGSSVISEIEEILKWLQSNSIVVLETTEVCEYLIEYPDIIDFLLSVSDRVRKRFVSPDQLSLELYNDPEIDDKYLTLYVRQEHYGDSIMDVIDSISAEYEEELSGTSGWMIVTTDFAPPR